MSVMMPSSGKWFFTCGHGTRHQTIGIDRFIRPRRFQAGIDHREQRQRGVPAAGSLRPPAAAGPATAARHRHRNHRFTPPARPEQTPINQIAWCERVFAHETAGKIVAPHTTHATGRNGPKGRFTKISKEFAWWRGTFSRASCSILQTVSYRLPLLLLSGMP